MWGHVRGVWGVARGWESGPARLTRGRLGVRPSHVLVHFGERDVQVEIERQNHARDEDDEDGEGGVLEVGQLDLQREGGGCEREAAVRGRRL